MCDFISIAARKALPREQPVNAPRGFRLSSYTNPNLSRYLPPNLELWTLTSGGCSCDLCREKKCEKGAPSLILRDDAARIIMNIAEKRSPSFLFVHFYEGNISTEEFPPLTISRLNVANLQKRYPIPYDTVFELGKSDAK